ncbi:hypothetical protein [Rhodovulum sulfidophilum]|nr:hypothetical protein [Rhodovulum sulfidophilum]
MPFTVTIQALLRTIPGYRAIAEIVEIATGTTRHDTRRGGGG